MKLCIEDQTGILEVMELGKSPTTVGRGPHQDLVLRDGNLPEKVGHIEYETESRSYWIRVACAQTPVRVYGVAIEQARMEPEVPYEVGGYKLTLRKRMRSPDLPPVQGSQTPWVTQSLQGARVLGQAYRAATSQLSVFLHGETGVGKDVLARLIHSWSSRKLGPYVALNCGALSEGLAESELFGHVAGAYTGADQNRVGALRRAHGGTLFLDEVADLKADLQVKLLRFLENGEVHPLGADRAEFANVRLLCASNKSLKEAVRSGEFRQDLYYRLASVTIRIPPLRDRTKDIDTLAKYFGKKHGLRLTGAALARLRELPWLGNVRQLKHVMDWVNNQLGTRRVVTPSDLEEAVSDQEGVPSLSESCGVTLREMEKRMIQAAMKQHHGNRSRAAKQLGLARSTIFKKLKEHQLVSNSPRGELGAGSGPTPGKA